MSDDTKSETPPEKENNVALNGGNGTSGTPSPASSERPADVKLGKCKWFNVLKGFGFITPDDGAEEVFVHQYFPVMIEHSFQSVLKMPGFRSLDEGETIEFAAKKSERGWEATYVSGPSSQDCKGSSVRPLGKKKHKKIRCFNCGQYGNHVASKCREVPQQDKVCYQCKGTDHLIAQCPQKSQQRPARNGPQQTNGPPAEQ